MSGVAKDNDKPIEAVIYDVDGTMYHLKRMRRLMARQLMVAFLRSPVRTWRDVRVIGAYRKAQELLRGGGEVDFSGGDPQLAVAARQLGRPVEAIQPRIDEWIHRRPLRILPRCRRPVVLETIRRLHEAGVKQGVYSDYPAGAKLEVLGVADCIDAVVWSAQAQVGQYKPSPRGFLRAAELLGAAPEAAVYVGDREDADGAGARAAGMQFLDVAQLETPEVLMRLAGLQDRP